MKLLHIYKDYYPIVGGIENHIRLICRGLRTYPDIEPTVLVTSRSTATTVELLDGVRVIKAGRLATISSAPLSLSLFAWVRRLDADITHLHFPYPIGELAYLLAGRSRRMVLTYHSDIVRQKVLLQVYRPFLRRVLARADAIAVSSAAYLQSSRYLQPVAGKCTIIPYGCDVSRFAPTDALAARARVFRQQHRPPLILFAGLLRYYKGIAFLIEAMQRIDGTLLLAGEGPEGETLRALAARLGLKDKVVFLGRVSDDDLAALYHACDVFVLPSIYRSESWGMVQVEAMACGKPVVCTELGTGTSFVNQDGVTGLVVPPKDAPALAAAINRLLADPDLRLRMGEAGRARATREFSGELMVDRLVQWYRGVL